MNLMFSYVIVLCIALTQATECDVEIDLGSPSCRFPDCTLERGLQRCLEAPACANSDEIACTLVTDLPLFGTGNTNLVIASSKIKSLRLQLGDSVLLQGDFLIHADNTLRSLLIQTNKTLTSIVGAAASTAVRFTSNNENSFFSLQDITFTDCATTDGSAPALELNTVGSILLDNVQFEQTSSSGDCGAAKIEIHETTRYSQGGRALYFQNTQAVGNGGALCIFASPGSNLTLSPAPFFENSSATLGGGLFLSGEADFQINYPTINHPMLFSAINGSLVYAENFRSLKVNNASLSLQESSTENGVIYAVSSFPTSLLEASGLFLRNATVTENGVLYIQDIDFVSLIDVDISYCSTQQGVVVFDGIDRIEVENSLFSFNTAREGAVFYCTNGNVDTFVTNVFFVESSSDGEFVDLSSDQSCSAAFWDSQVPCSDNFSLCASGVTSISGSSCSCYCDSDEICVRPSSTSSPSPSIEPSNHLTSESLDSSSQSATSPDTHSHSSQSESQTQMQTHTHTHKSTSLLWLWILLPILSVLCILSCIVIIGLIVIFCRIGKLGPKLRNQFDVELHPLEDDSIALTMDASMFE